MVMLGNECWKSYCCLAGEFARDIDDGLKNRKVLTGNLKSLDSKWKEHAGTSLGATTFRRALIERRIHSN